MNDVHHGGASARLEIRINSKSYASNPPHEVLRDIELHLADGEVAAIVGPSGCGKTTLLRIIAGLDKEFDGRVALPHRPGSKRAKIGMVFQEPRLLPWCTVEANVRLAAPEASARALDALFDTLGLSAHRRHYPGQLSLGLARRVALARAFAIEPDILLLDEPFVSLDAALAAKLRAELARLVDRTRVTALLVTHDLDEALELADRIFVFSGRPARIAAAIPITLPRSARTSERIAEVRRGLVIGSGNN